MILIGAEHQRFFALVDLVHEDLHPVGFTLFNLNLLVEVGFNKALTDSERVEQLARFSKKVKESLLKILKSGNLPAAAAAAAAAGVGLSQGALSSADAGSAATAAARSWSMLRNAGVWCEVCLFVLKTRPRKTQT